MRSFLLLSMGVLPAVCRAFAPIIQQRRAIVLTARYAEEQNKIPMTLLSGFLGSGKTSTLKHLLENTDGVKIGILVNDVASVNIDAKLISKTTQDGMIELQNGCACCSLADELLAGVDSLLKRTSRGGEQQLDAVVVELSGVADPAAVKANWKTAKLKNHPATKVTELSKVVTLVDACTFGTDWMTYDIAGYRKGWTEEGDDCTGQRQVTELLAEQVEAADLILINKIDLASKEEVAIASSVVRGLNKEADVQSVKFGKISPEVLLGDLVKIGQDYESHDHSHFHDCVQPDCDDGSHVHGNVSTGSDGHSHDYAASCNDASHSHDHSSSTSIECADPTCADHSHSHVHASTSEVCTDTDCTDTSHSHSHSHRTSTDQLKITNFVYKRDRPFDAKRLLDILNQWPVPLKDNLDLALMMEAQVDGYSIGGITEKGNPFVGVLRSKGFVWLAPNKWMGANNDAYRHDTAMYWSHAGKHFGISSAGKWWGTIPKEDIKKYFPPDDPEYDRILEEDFLSEEWGDRRQEIVFIGLDISEKDISDALDKCLLRDTELQRYRQEVGNFHQMILNAKSAGLFDEGGIDQYDPSWNF